MQHYVYSLLMCFGFARWSGTAGRLWSTPTGSCFGPAPSSWPPAVHVASCVRQTQCLCIDHWRHRVPWFGCQYKRCFHSLQGSWLARSAQAHSGFFRFWYHCARVQRLRWQHELGWARDLRRRCHANGLHNAATSHLKDLRVDGVCQRSAKSGRRCTQTYQLIYIYSSNNNNNKNYSY